MDSSLLRLIVVLLFGVVVGGGVYLALAIVEWRQQRDERVASMEAEALLAQTQESADGE